MQLRGALRGPLVVFGLSGSGKTTLAACLAHDSAVAAQFPDGVFWLTDGQVRKRLVAALSVLLFVLFSNRECPGAVIFLLLLASSLLVFCFVWCFSNSCV
jgi:hypothetical protein